MKLQTTSTGQYFLAIPTDISRVNGMCKGEDWVVNYVDRDTLMLKRVIPNADCAHHGA